MPSAGLRKSSIQVGLTRLHFIITAKKLDYIEDSVGRKVRFEYETHCLIPRIKKIWVRTTPITGQLDDIGKPRFLMEAWMQAAGSVNMTMT